MRNIYVFAIVIGIFCISLGTVGWAQPVKVGAVINLSGPASTWGQYHAKGLQDYFRYVNEVKGGVVGRKIELTVADHAYKVPEGLKFVKKFCEEKVDTMATWDAGLGIQAKPIVQEYKIPTLNFSTYQGILKPPIDYVYLPFGSFALDCQAVLEYIRTTHKGKAAPKVGLLTFNNLMGRAIHDPSKEYADKHNIDIVSIEEFPPATVDLTTEMLRLKGKGAEYVILQMLPASAISALKAAERLNFNVPFFADWALTDPDFFKLGKGLIRDRVAMQFCGCLPEDKKWGTKLMEDLWERYKSVDKLDNSYWEGIVIAMIMERGIHRASGLFGKINSEMINKAMETFNNEDFGGLVPYVTFTKDNHEGSYIGRIVKVHEDGTLTPLTNFFVPGKGEIKILKGK